MTRRHPDVSPIRATVGCRGCSGTATVYINVAFGARTNRYCKRQQSCYSNSRPQLVNAKARSGAVRYLQRQEAESAPTLWRWIPKAPYCKNRMPPLPRPGSPVPSPVKTATRGTSMLAAKFDLLNAGSVVGKNALQLADESRHRCTSVFPAFILQRQVSPVDRSEYLQ